MNVELPTRATVKMSAPGRAGNGGRADRSVWLLVAAYLGVVVVYVVWPEGGAARAAFGHAALVASMVVAVVACVRAARRSRRGRRLAWYLFAGAALAAVVGQVLWAVEQEVMGREIAIRSLAIYFLLLFHPLFCAGAAVALRPARARGVTAITLDGSLIVTGALLLVGRYLFEPLVVGPPLAAGDLSVVVLAQFGAVSSCLFAGLLVLWGDLVLPGRAVPALAGTAGVFLAATILTAAGVDASPRSPGDAFDLVWLAGWAMLAVAGFAGAGGGRDVEAEAEADRIRRRLRRVVAPGAALFLGATAVDAALHPGRLRQVAVMAVILAVLLALRITYAVGEADRRAEEGEQLSHTRALVELNRALAGATELNQTLELVARWACRLLDARAAGIELLTPDGTTLELRASHGLPARVIGLRFPVEGSFTGWVVQRRRPRATVDPSADPYIRPESAEFLEARPTAAAPLYFGDRPLGALFAANRDLPFAAADLELLGSLADQAALAIENAQLFEQVHALSLTDPLTGLANRRQLEQDVAREFAAAERGRKLVLVLFDLDGFKEYNDRYGHLAGDEVLRIFGHVLTAETRSMNHAARYGGDEFLVLLAETGSGGARSFVKRIAREFGEAMAGLDHSRVTVSAGIASYDAQMQSPDELIAAADRALYETKAERSPRAKR